ncbi:MAG: response regulator [bacterium]|nr:response regulator [bacterium]
MGEGKILIVDDDGNTRAAYKDLFIGCGFEAAVAENENQALELLRSESFQAVLLDLRVSNNVLLPIAERMKKEFPKVFISMMLIDSTPALMKRAIKAGIDDYQVKPILPMRLIDVIQKGILRYTLEEENFQLKKMVAELQERQKWIMHDLETGVFNSQYFSERLDMEVKRAKRHEHWLSLLLCDMARSSQGVEGNEETSASPPSSEILELLKVLSGNVRNVDIISRYNTGFAIILPETTTEGSFILCNRLKRTLADTFEGSGSRSDCGSNRRLNVRFGVATYPVDSHLPRKLIKIAEDRLQ